MLTSPKMMQGAIVAAVAFDEQSDAVVAAAAALARRLDKDLHIVNVVEEETMQPWAFEVTAYYYNLPLPCDSIEERVKTAAARLSILGEAFHAKVRVRSDVLVGEPAEMLMTYCKLHRASMLVTACASSYGELSGFFSTTLTLMAQAPLPVLVVGTRCASDLERSKLAIMVADDLEDGSEDAVSRTLDLALRLPAQRVRQVHVHGNHRPPRAGEESFRERDHEARRQKLSARASQIRALLPERMLIEIDIREGDVSAELAASVADFQPDILVFGRHKSLKFRPFLIGKVPFRQMLKSPCAVLVVPSSQDLYDRTGGPEFRAT